MAAVATAPVLTDSRTAALESEKYLSSRVAGASANPAFRSIAIIDLAPSFSSSLAARQAVAKQIHEACTTVGFFYITGHGMEALCGKALKLAERFHEELPQAAKEAIHMQNSAYFRGYEPAAYSSVNHFTTKETKEAFNWAYEAGLDLTGGDGKYVELDGTKPNEKSNLWPKEEDLPGFYKGIAEYYGNVSSDLNTPAIHLAYYIQALQLCRHLFRLFALSLDLPEGFFDSMTTHPGGIARLIKYRPNANPKPLSALNKDEELGLGAHTDYECFTMLLQDSNPGLEILSPDGQWVSANPVPGGIVVNVADFLMRWTNGVYKSTVHRVVNRTDQIRYSVPLFFSINYDAMVETLPSCVSEENPSKFPPITAGKYVYDRLALTIPGMY